MNTACCRRTLSWRGPGSQLQQQHGPRHGPLLPTPIRHARQHGTTGQASSVTSFTGAGSCRSQAGEGDRGFAALGKGGKKQQRDVRAAAAAAGQQGPTAPLQQDEIKQGGLYGLPLSQPGDLAEVTRALEGWCTQQVLRIVELEGDTSPEGELYNIHVASTGDCGYLRVGAQECPQGTPPKRPLPLRLLTFFYDST